MHHCKTCTKFIKMLKLHGLIFTEIIFDEEGEDCFEQILTDDVVFKTKNALKSLHNMPNNVRYC